METFIFFITNCCELLAISGKSVGPLNILVVLSHSFRHTEMHSARNAKLFDGRTFFKSLTNTKC